MAIVAAGALVRVAWCLVAARQPEWFGDPFAYLNHARDLADGAGYVVWLDGAPTAYYPVGYPALLGGALWLVQSITRTEALVPTIVGLNLVASVIAIVAVHGIGRRLGGDRVADVAALLVALFPSLVLYSATAHLEVVFTALVLVAVWIAVGWPVASWRLVALGVVIGATTLVRPVVLPIVVVLLVWWWRGLGRPTALRSTAVVLAAAALVVAPWSIRSTAKLDGFVLVSTNTGDNLCVGHSPESKGRYHDLVDFCWGGEEDEVARDGRNRREAIEYAREHPGRELWLLSRKAWHLVAHDHEGLHAVESYGEDRFLTDGQRTTVRWIADLYYWLAVAAALVGVAVARRQQLALRGVLLWSAVVVLAVPLVFFGGSRFHVPALPFVALFASVALTRTRT